MVGQFWFKCSCGCNKFTSGGLASDMPSFEPEDTDPWSYSVWFNCADCGERVFSVDVTKSGNISISNNLTR